jgi:hypothetical protein
MPKVKRAVSLPKELDSYLSAMARESGRSYSGLVAEAIGVFRGSLERSRMAQAYAEYYADKGRVKSDAASAREMANASAAGWPDWEP